MIYTEDLHIIFDAIDDHASIFLLMEALVPLVQSPDDLESVAQARAVALLRNLEVGDIVSTVTGDVQQVVHRVDDSKEARVLTDGYFTRALYLRSLKYGEDIGWRGVP